MNLDSQRPSEQEKRRRIQVLADQAVAHANGLDLDRYPNAHISRALQGIPQGRERDRLFQEISAELKRRGFKSPQERIREEQQMLEDERKKRLLRDAYFHEQQIDPHERNDDDQEAA